MAPIKPKRPVAVVPFLQAFIDEIVNAGTEDDLSRVLEKFDSPNHFERPEERYLLNWCKVLNRFDEILERYVSDRNILAKPSSAKHQDKSAHKSLHRERSKRDKSSSQSEGPSDFVSSAAQQHPAAVDSSGASPKRDPEPENKPLPFSPSSSLVRLVLRVTQRLIRNASHDSRNLYNSVEHLGALLADENTAIVLLTLEILNMLMQRSHKIRSSRSQITTELSDRLLDLAGGWGGRENRLGLLDCCSSKDTELLPRHGGRLCFEYTRSKSSSANPATQTDGSPNRRERQHGSGPLENAAVKSVLQISPRNSSSPIPLAADEPELDIPPDAEPEIILSGLQSRIVIDDVSLFRGTERWLLSTFALRHQVPKSKLFSLLCAFRRAKAFVEGREARIELTVIRLYALTTLFQLQPIPSKAYDLITKEPELIQDLTFLAGGNSRDGVEDVPRCLRIIAVRCMTAMSAERPRAALVMSASGGNLHHGALPSLLRDEIAFLLSTSNNLLTPTDKAGVELLSTEATINEQHDLGYPGKLGRGQGGLTLFNECDRVSASVQRTHMTEALLALVHILAVSGGSSGATPLANSGILATLIPLLTDADGRHARVVSQAIRAMQAILESSPQSVGCQLFKDNDGLGLVAERIAQEVSLDDMNLSEQEREARDEKVEVEALQRRGESRALYEKLGRCQMTPQEALDHPSPSASTASRGLLPHSKWALIRTLHQLLLGALGNGGNEVRELVVQSKLPYALRKILAQPFLHGGNLFQSAASVTTEIAHTEPTATPDLVKAGLASTVLRTIGVGLPPCGEAVRCIPNILAALCLAPTAKKVIVEAKPLKRFLLRLATPFYTRALHGETPVLIGSALDELMRHVEPLRSHGNEAVIEYLRLSAKFIETDSKGFKRLPRPNSSPGDVVRGSNSANVPTSDGKPSGTAPGQVVSLKGDLDRNTPDGVLLERMKLAVANNSCRLVGFAQGSSEHQQGIVDNGGLKYMIQLRDAPALASAETCIRDGQSSARHYPTPANTVHSLVSALKTFGSRHYAALVRILFSVILEDAAVVLKIAKDLDERWLPEEDTSEAVDIETQEIGQYVSRQDSSSDSGAKSVVSLGVQPHLQSIEMKEVDKPSEATSSSEDTKEAVTSNGQTKNRVELREKMRTALKQLRVAVVLLTRMPRGGSLNTLTSPSVWEASRGSQVAAIVSTVERAARYHLAVVYTGLTLSAANDGDLSNARVTATSDPELKPIRPEQCEEIVGNLGKLFGTSIETNPDFVQACQRYRVPPEGYAPLRQNVEGLAWCLVTFAVAAQRLYSVLSKALVSSRRLPRGLRYGAGAKSVANAIGRIFALHLVAAVPLWDVKVISMGRNRVVAAWDYLRGILIEIKGTLFGEDHGMTQSLILKSFLDAGGADALLQATRPFLIVQAATSKNLTETETTRASKVAVRAKMEELLKNSSLSVCSYLLAIGDVYDRLPRASSLMNTGGLSGGLPSADGEDTVMSSDSVRNQAHAISKIAVKESQVQADTQSEGSTKVQMRFEDLKSLLTSPSRKDALRAQTNRLREEAFAHCHEAAIRRVASDVWNTLCGFLHLLASCPGLLNSGASPIPDSPGRRTEWEARDIQRSALTVTLQLLTSVTSHPTELLAAFRPDGSAMSDVLGIVHTTSEVAAEMEGKKGTVPVKTRGPEEDGVPESRQFDPPPLRRPSPDPENLRSLVEMGFPERRAAYALRRTAPAGIEFAIEWLMTQMDEADDALQSDDAEEPRWQISAAENTTDNGETNRNPNDDAADEGDSNNEDDDNSSEGRSQAEDEESNGNADVVESDGAHNSEQSLDVADDNHDADSAMEDTEAADVDVSEHQDQGIHDEPAAPGSPSSGSPMSTGRGRSLGRSRQKPHRKPSTAKRKELLTLNVAADQDGRRLVEVALFNELALLSGALEKSSAVPDSDIPLYRSTAAGHIEMSSSSDLLNGGKPQDMSVRTVPIPIESFIAKKKQLFESLLDVTRTVIEACDQHEHGRHFPYLAIELLSVLQKSSSWLEKGSTEFAELVHKGLRLALEQQLGDGGLRHGLSGQTAAIWSHYGGNRARRALQQCGTFRLGYECLVRSIDEWETATAVPLVDIEATQPIKYLSIEEKKQDMCDTVSKKLAKTTGESNAGRLASTKRSMRSVTRSEAVKLKQITTCLLLLDASVRFESTDKIIESCKEVEKVPKSISAGKDSEEGDQEKMDTDEKNSELANQCEDDSQDPGAMNVSEARKALSEVMRDVFGTPSSAMEIDAVPADEEDVDLDTLHDRAQECKSVLVDKAEVEIMGWLSKKTEKTISSSFPTEALLSHCLSLLKLWNGVEVGDALLAVLQLLGSLTADWGLAQSAIDSGLTSELLRLPQLESHKSRSTNCKVARMLTRTILRHLIEDPESLHEAMVSELRSIFTSSQPRARVSYSMKSLISAASPMIARDLQCFLSALTKSVRTTNIRTSDSDGSQELELNDYKQLNTSEMESVLSHRSNVKSVISAISCLLSGTVLEHESREHQDSRLSATETLTNNGIERTAFALELLTDFVEFSQVAAVAFIKTPSPTSDISGSALDYIIQKFIPFPEAPETKNVSSQSLARVSSGREEVCIAARKLFLALCSKTANTHEDAVRGLARATKREADKEHACANVIAGLAQCIVPGTKFRVLRVVLETDFANDLARSLQRLDLSFEKNFEVASSVLRAITLIGRAATYMARHDDENPDDTPFGTSSRDPFGLRVQDDGLGHPGGFMVL